MSTADRYAEYVTNTPPDRRGREQVSTEATPLTAEEEALVRHRIRGYGDHSYERTIDALLATLTRERAEHADFTLATARLMSTLNGKPQSPATVLAMEALRVIFDREAEGASERVRAALDKVKG